MKKRIAALLLLAALLPALGPTIRAEAAETERTVHISTAEQLRQLARDCTMDSFSRGLTVVLDGDIDLGEEEFCPIPSFNGVFDGGGHQVTNMITATDGSHQGMFRYIQAGGKVKNLRLEGTVAPDNSRCQVGGLAGTNYGSIENCSFTGTVSGLNYVGGLVGENYGTVAGCSVGGSVDGKRFTGGVAGFSAGTISGCENEAKVNTGITEGGLELESLNLSGLTNLDLTDAEDTDVVSDSGGVVGFSKGVVTDCVNRGTVGYPHYGYNVGGVAGRQSGTMNDCENRGAVYGRKDVGGVVGQMEPYMLLKNTASLASELNRLHALVSAAMGNLTNMSSEIHTVLEEIRRSAEEAKQNLGGKTPEEPQPTQPQPTQPQPTEPQPTQAQPTEPQPTTGPQPAEPSESDPEPAPQPEPPALLEPQATPAETLPEPAADRGGNAGGFVLLAVEEPVDGAGDVSGESGGSGTGDDSGGGDGNSGDEGDSGGLLPDLDQLPGLDQLPDLSEDLDRLTGGMGDLVTIMGNSSGELGRDLVAVSDQLTRVLIMMANAMTGDANHQVFEDISEGPDGDGTAGLVEVCENAGSVEGDRNVGGVTGTMGIEYEFDMEGTLAQNLGMGSILSSTYQTRCVSSANINRGQVQAKWDNVGGIAGLQELGLVSGCQSYGKAASGEGGYAGGVVGYASSAVRDCYAMCAVDGTEYVGGIAGYGTKLTGCVSVVSLGDVTACAGAVAGWADMTGDGVGGNVFVHESLGAVDGISYEGRAEPVAFETLLERENLPEDFKNLKLTFTVQGETVAELPFDYGGGIDPAQIPQVPPREGYTGSWPDYDYSHLTFSDTLEAKYVSRQAALASEELRDDGPLSLVLLEGDFSDGASVGLNAYAGDGPLLEQGGILEKWVLNLEDGDYTGGNYTVRYLPPETERSSAVELYVRRDGAWSKVPTGRSGSYLTFEVQGKTVVFCAVERERAGTDSVVLAAVAAGLALAAGTAVVLIRRRKKKAAVPEEKSG